jgi:hypothetical protein
MNLPSVAGYIATTIFHNVTIAHDKGKPVARQGRKAVNLLSFLVNCAGVIRGRLSGCRRRSEKMDSPPTALLSQRYRIDVISVASTLAYSRPSGDIWLSVSFAVLVVLSALLLHRIFFHKNLSFSVLSRTWSAQPHWASPKSALPAPGPPAQAHLGSIESRERD